MDPLKKRANIATFFKMSKKRKKNKIVWQKKFVATALYCELRQGELDWFLFKMFIYHI